MTQTVNFVWRGDQTEEVFRQNNLFRERAELAHRRNPSERELETTVFLTPLEEFSQPFINELRELGYPVIDAGRLADEVSSRLPRIESAYARWRGIRHLGIVRYLVAKTLFQGESILVCDTDIIRGFPLSEVETMFGTEPYLLHGSSCMTWIPKGSALLENFSEASDLLETDHESYNERYWGFDDAAKVFEPHQTHGTDQAILLALIRSGDIKTDSHRESILNEQGWELFANWLSLTPREDPLTYSRRDHVDYVGERKVLASHLSNDTCNYFGQFVLQERVFDHHLSRDGHCITRFPKPYWISDDDTEPEVKALAAMRYDVLCIADKLGLRESRVNPFSRAAVAQRFYLEGDLSSICQEGVWGRSGVFA